MLMILCVYATMVTTAIFPFCGKLFGGRCGSRQQVAPQIIYVPYTVQPQQPRIENFNQQPQRMPEQIPVAPKPVNDCPNGTCPKKPILFGQDIAPEDNQGIDLDKLGKEKKCTVNGKDASLKECVRLLEARESQLRDISPLGWLVIIGTKEQQREGLTKIPADLLKYFNIKTLTYEEVLERKLNYDVRPNESTLYCLAPDGSVKHKQFGANGFEQAVKKASPNYDPSKDSDLTKPVAPVVPTPTVPDSLDTPKKVGGGAVLGVLLAFLAAFLKKWLAKQEVKKDEKPS